MRIFNFQRRKAGYAPQFAAWIMLQYRTKLDCEKTHFELLFMIQLPWTLRRETFENRQRRLVVTADRRTAASFYFRVRRGPQWSPWWMPFGGEHPRVLWERESFRWTVTEPREVTRSA